MAQYEIEVDSQDEFYESNGQQQQQQNQPKLQDQQKVQVRSVVKRKGRGFSVSAEEEPSTKVLGEIKHFDTVKEEVSGRSLRCKLPHKL